MAVSPRVLLSYAHEAKNPHHVDRVRALYDALRANGVDAQIDLIQAEQRTNWIDWMTREIRLADFVLVIASPSYRRRAEGHAAPGEGRGVQWEAAQIQELLYADQRNNVRRVLPVVLHGCSAQDIPDWLRPVGTTHYRVGSPDEPGFERLLRVLLGLPFETEAPLGTAPHLPPRDRTVASSASASASVQLDTGLTHLSARRYDDAYRSFARALDDSPGDSEALYYAALSLLAGQRLDLLTPERVRRVESCLSQATQNAPDSCHAWALWAVLKEAHYQATGRGDGTPRVDAAITHAQGLVPLRRTELVRHIHAPMSPFWRSLQHN